MIDTEVNVLLDAHDALVQAYLDASLTFAAFVSAYDSFSQNYALDGHEAVTVEERAMLARFPKHVAFHVRVSDVSSKVCSEEDNANPLYAEAGRFVPARAQGKGLELVHSTTLWRHAAQISQRP